MENNLYLFDEDARQKLKSGIDILAKAVASTLGPKGRNVIFHPENSKDPHVTKDGVTVAKQVKSHDQFEQMGIDMIRQAAQKTADEAGDGTTTATILAQAMIHEGIRHLTAGANPVDLKRGIDATVEQFVEILDKMSEEVGNDMTKIQQIATISANNDPVIGSLVAKALQESTFSGKITIEESATNDTYVETIKGMHFDEGYIDNFFINDETRKIATLDNPLIIVSSETLVNIDQIEGMLQYAIDENRPVLVIADHYELNAAKALFANLKKHGGGLDIVAVRAPGYAEIRKTYLHDIAISTGSLVINSDTGNFYKSANEHPDTYMGSADRVIVYADNTIILGAHGSEEMINARIASIDHELNKALHHYDKQLAETRKAKLVGGISVIYVGANTESEVKERVDRIDDALRATRSAIERGIVPGGGTAYIEASKQWKPVKAENEDQAIGEAIVIKAIERPLLTIMENAGLTGEIILQRVRETGKGYNAKIDEYENLKENGVIDPTKVAIVALKNAASVAGMVLISNCMIGR